MHTKYKIVEAWEDSQTIVVRYYTDDVSEYDLRSSDVMKPDGTPVRCRTDVSISIKYPRPTEQELEEIIHRNCPAEFIKMQELLKSNTVDLSMTAYANRIGIETSFTANTVDSVIQSILNNG